MTSALYLSAQAGYRLVQLAGFPTVTGTTCGLHRPRIKRFVVFAPLHFLVQGFLNTGGKGLARAQDRFEQSAVFRCGTDCGESSGANDVRLCFAFHLQCN